MLTTFYQSLRDRLYHWLTDEPPAEEAMPYDFNRLKHEIKPGDVLLIEGRSHVSNIIRSITQSPWTHAALYIGRLVDMEDADIQTMLRAQKDIKEFTYRDFSLPKSPKKKTIMHKLIFISNRPLTFG